MKGRTFDRKSTDVEIALPSHYSFPFAGLWTQEISHLCTHRHISLSSQWITQSIFSAITSALFPPFFAFSVNLKDFVNEVPGREIRTHDEVEKGLSVPIHNLRPDLPFCTGVTPLFFLQRRFYSYLQLTLLPGVESSPKKATLIIFQSILLKAKAKENAIPCLSLPFHVGCNVFLDLTELLISTVMRRENWNDTGDIWRGNYDLTRDWREERLRIQNSLCDTHRSLFAVCRDSQSLWMFRSTLSHDWSRIQKREERRGHWNQFLVCTINETYLTKSRKEGNNLMYYMTTFFSSFTTFFLVLCSFVSRFTLFSPRNRLQIPVSLKTDMQHDCQNAVNILWISEQKRRHGFQW